MSFSAERFERMESIFHEALATEPGARGLHVAVLCGEDDGLRAEVEALLAANVEEERLNTTMRNRPTGRQAEWDAMRRMGPYALDGLIGRGGMGAVYLAHRADGQYERKVAIKLIDLPLATEVFRERFRMERQILASLDHPYIARLLDGGVSEDGELYLVMEYVDGVPIHRYCKEHKLDLRGRLTLFRKVCEAVQFAHQNLVVHRDLKPDNILVVEDGTPRLLDFGTAKLISQASPGDGLHSGADLTVQGYQSFTPQYASPEQVLGHPITTATDTYSLGVLLYLLLTGVAPYELKEMSTAELVRVICEEPPRKPKAQGEGLRLDADLEAILAKALRKEPQERYRTAEGMAADVASYLGGLPVGARKGNLRYRAGKFARRNRWAIAGAGLIALVLAAGVAGVVWQARIANEQRRMAEARSADLRQLSNSLLSELADAIKQLPGSTGVQQLLVTRVLEHLDRMARDAEGDRQTQLDLVDAYARLGNIQGNAYDQNLGDPKGGLASLNKALAMAKPLAAADATKADALRSLAFVEQSRSEIMYHMGDTENAVAAMKEAVASFSTLIANPHATPELLGEAASAFGSLGDQLGAPGTPSLGDRAGAIAWYRKTIDVDNRALGIDPHYLRCLRGLAIMQIKLGTVEMETDPAQALKDFQLGLERVKALPEAQQGSMMVTRIRYMLMRKEANAYSELGEYAKAIPLYEAMRGEQEKVLAADAKDLRAMADVEIDLDDEAQSYENAADDQLQPVSAAEKRRNLEKARELSERAARVFDQMLARDGANTLWKSSGAMKVVRIGLLNAELGDRPVDVAAVTKALDSIRRMASDANATPATLSEAADAFVEARPARLRDARFALACAQREAAGSHGDTPARFLALSMAYRGMGDIPKARDAAQRGLAMMTPPVEGKHGGRLYRELSLASEGKDLNLVPGGVEQ